MHAGSQLEQPEHPTARGDLALGGLDRSREQLQDGALARPVRPDNPQRLAGRHREAHAVERPELLMLHGSPSKQGQRHSLKRAGRLVADDKPLADIAQLDGGR